MKKLILILLYIISIKNTKGQLYQHFIFKNNIVGQYDMTLQPIALKALSFYYSKQLDSSAFYYLKLLKSYPSYYQGYYNLSRVYSSKSDKSQVLTSISNYIRLSGSDCKCSFLNSVFENFKMDSTIEMLRDSCCSKFLEYCNKEKITNPNQYLQLESLDGIEQEILGNTYLNKNEKNDLLKLNFKKFLAVIDTNNLPRKDSIGKAIAYVELLILHLDYLPNLQYSLGKKLFKNENRGYFKKMAAYIIDRALRNLGKPQIYGTLIEKDTEGKFKLYKVDKLKKVIKRRRKIGFQTIEEFQKNKEITK